MVSSDFTEILGNVAAKTLRAAYMAQPKSFEPFVTKGTLADYKPAKRVAIGDAPSLLAVAEGEDYETGTVGEGAEQITLGKYGRILSISEEAIQNDDLGAFARLPALFGNAAARLESSLVYGVLLGNPNMADTKALFHADHGNLASGSEIDLANLNAAKKLMRTQKGIGALEDRKSTRLNSSH